MKKSLMIALALVALPVLAQEAPQKPCDKPCGPKPCMRHHHHGHKHMHKGMMEKFDANKDGQLDEQEKAAMKADFEAKHAEMKAKFMEKFDVNKNGQIDEDEKAAIKADFEARHGDKKPGCGKKGPRGPKCGMHKAMMEKFDANKDGQLDEQEKEAMKAEFEAKHAEMKAKFMEKFDVNKNGQIDEDEKAAIKADFEANGPKGPHGCCPCKKG